MLNNDVTILVEKRRGCGKGARAPITRVNVIYIDWKEEDVKAEEK